MRNSDSDVMEGRKLSLKSCLTSSLPKTFIDSGDFVWNSGIFYSGKLVVLSISFEGRHYAGLGGGF